MDKENNRPFAVVQFPEEENSLSVVPSIWLKATDQQSIFKCRWPLQNPTKAAKKLLKPSENWPVFDARLIHFSRSYDSANIYLDKFRYQSDIEYSATDVDESRKRVRVTPTSSYPLPVTASQNTEAVVPSLQDFNRLEAKVDGLLKHVLNLENTISELNGKISVCCGDRSSALCNKDFKLLESLDDVEAFELKLFDEGEFSKAVEACSCLGGRDFKDATRRILMKVFSHQVSLLLSWSKSPSKSSLQKYTKIILFITISLRSNSSFQHIPQQEVEDVIKRWFRYAADRCGGRLMRLKRKCVTAP